MQYGNRLRAIWRYVRSPEHFARLVVPLIGAIPIAVLFSTADLMHKVEAPLVQWFEHRPPPPQIPVTVVAITEEDFTSYFDSKRPLDPDRLGVLIDAIAGLDPRIIAVDVRTSDTQFEKLAERPFKVPVIWARRVRYSQILKAFYPEDVLGGKATATWVAAVRRDADDVVRRYDRCFQLPNGGELRALPAKLAVELGGDTKCGERLINFSGIREKPRYPADQFLDGTAVGSADLRKAVAQHAVVLGGEFGDFDALDEHRTPVGWISGLQLLAHIAETDSSNQAPATRDALTATILVGSFIMAVAFASMRLSRALAITGAVFLCSLGAVFGFTRSVRDCVLLFAVFLVVFVQQMYGVFKEMAKSKPQPAAEGSAETAQPKYATKTGA